MRDGAGGASSPGAPNQAFAQKSVETQTDPCRQFAAGIVDDRERCVGDPDDQGQHDERRDRPAGEHPIVDLQHVDRPGEQQDVGEDAEQGDRDEQ